MLITNKRSYGSLFFLLKSLFLAVRGNIESLGVALIFLYLFYYLPISVFSLVFFVYPPSVSINPLPPATTRLTGTPIPSPLWRSVITHPDFRCNFFLPRDSVHDDFASPTRPRTLGWRAIQGPNGGVERSHFLASYDNFYSGECDSCKERSGANVPTLFGRQTRKPLLERFRECCRMEP